MVKYAYALLAFLLLLGCKKDTPPNEVEGMRPIYAKDVLLKAPSVTAPRSFHDLGKMYYRAPWLFAVENGKGIHVIDNSDPANPKPTWFYAIDFCYDLAIKGNRLYTDQAMGKDLSILVLDISDMSNIKLLSRESVPNTNFQQSETALIPLTYSGYFECPDAAKGPVVGWEKAIIKNPRCKTAR
jgi:hypothetical protein